MANSSRLVFTQKDGAATAQPADSRGVVGRHEVFQDAGAAGGFEPLGGDDVLEGRGMPVRAVASPRRSRASASFAWARAPASSTVIYALMAPNFVFSDLFWL